MIYKPSNGQSVSLVAVTAMVKVEQKGCCAIVLLYLQLYCTGNEAPRLNGTYMYSTIGPQLLVLPRKPLFFFKVKCYSSCPSFSYSDRRKSSVLSFFVCLVVWPLPHHAMRCYRCFKRFRSPLRRPHGAEVTMT